MDRDELEERVRQRRPGDALFRRGVEPEAVDAYREFKPEPEDQLAAREPDAPAPETHVDNTPPDFDAEAPSVPEEYIPEDEPVAEPVVYVDEDVEEPPVAYPYLSTAEERSDSSALPLLGFAALAVMALAVGVILAGLFTGPNGVADTSPSPSLGTSSEPSISLEPATPSPSEATSSGSPATPEPTDGPVSFPDGATLTVQPCGTYEFKADLSGCKVDGSTRTSGTVWVLATFKQASGKDQLTLVLQQAGETLDRQDKTIGDIVDCGNRCSGLIWAAIYRDLAPGDYDLILRRNGDFADRATFTVQ